MIYNIKIWCVIPPLKFPIWKLYLHSKIFKKNKTKSLQIEYSKTNFGINKQYLIDCLRFGKKNSVYVLIRLSYIFNLPVTSCAGVYLAGQISKQLLRKAVADNRGRLLYSGEVKRQPIIISIFVRWISHYNVFIKLPTYVIFCKTKICM